MSSPTRNPSNPENVEMRDYDHGREDEEDEEDEEEEEEEEDAEGKLQRTEEEKNEKIFGDMISEVMKFDKKDYRGRQDLVNSKVEENKEDVKNKATNGKTILHQIVDAAIEKKEGSDINLKYLISALTTNYRDLTLQLDRDELTPLHYAIKKKAAKVVNWMLIAFNTKMLEPTLDQVLLKSDKSQNNCLHSAVVDARFKPSIIKRLIDYVHSRETICAKNLQKRTPLHLAVEYSRCSESQVEVVKKMIKHWDVALDVNVVGEEGDESEERSVFRHHLWSRERSSRQKPLVNGNQKSDEKAKRPPIPEKKAPESGITPKVPQPVKPHTAQTGPKTNATTQHIAEKADDPRNQLSGQGLARRVTGLKSNFQDNDPKGDKQGKALDKRRAKSEVFENSQPKEGEKAAKKPTMTQGEAADEIRDTLKMHYMCTRDDHRQILSFLYGPHEVKQICLSFSEDASEINEARLNRMRYVRFDETLHYLELPCIEIKRSRPQTTNTEEDCEGRRDYEAVFNWLKKKDVKHIIHLSVVDDYLRPHSNESIEQALKGLKVVKTWNWCKLDIDSDTILKAAPDIQEVVLYWSGNNAVLRGWSEQHGLHKLQNLKKITIHGTPGLETKRRAQSHLDDFKNRMEALRGKADTAPVPDEQDSTPPKIEVEMRLENSASRPIGTNGPVHLVQNHPPEDQKWIACMKRFTSYARDLLEKECGSKPVRIALIDDGIDFADERITTMVEDGRSYFQRSNKLIQPFWTSSGSHGTAMAGLIRTMCPVAKLFIFRLNEYTSENGRRQIYPGSATQAIRSAITQGVDIISMSWTIGSDGADEGIKKFKTAVEEAERHNILMFCAASDQGVAPDRSFPGESNCCFKIGAATIWGTPHEFLAQSVNPVDYIFPGHNVVQEQGGNKKADRTNLLTGSSVATALATGLAALILRCVQFAAQHYEDEKNLDMANEMKKSIQELKTRQRMREAFEQIRTIPMNGAKYVEVWNVFGNAGTKIEDEDPAQKRKWVLNIANRLVAQISMTQASG